MASNEARQLAEQLKIFRDRVIGTGQAPTLEEQRAGSDMMGTFGTERPDVTETSVDAGGTPALLHEPASPTGRRVVLYLHGGGYVVGSARTHARLAAHLAGETGAAVLNLDYRRAPEDPFPAAFEDATRAYRWLLDQGYEPGSIAMAGDSAGGGMALALLMSIRDAGGPLPAAGALLSPWVDMALNTTSLTTRADRDIFASLPILDAFRTAFLGDNPTDDPRVSPVYGDFSGLPPLRVQVSDDEVLVDDSHLIVQKAQEAGVEATLDLYDGVPHVFQLWAGNLPEADEAIAKIAAFLSERFATVETASAS